jgi:ribosomal protein S18 acetylase RimI-like enzyme
MDHLDYRYQIEPGDRELVRQIVESTGFFNPAEVAIAVELVEERLAKGPASGYHFILAQSAGRTCGYACYGPIAGTQASYDLYWIVVHRDFQFRGLGGTILAHTEERIHHEGGRRIWVETSSRDQYAPTRHFYERHGYHHEASLKDFYAPGDDKVIYVK